MHRGVREFIRWLEGHRDRTDVVRLERPGSADQLASLEQQLGVPLPADLRLVLTRFNGGVLPSGTLLPAGTGPGTIEAAVRELAAQFDADFLDPELLLPFHRTAEGSLLAFDRSAGPVPDSWPVVDYFDDTGEVRLVHRTFDGWCHKCVLDWGASDFDQSFSLDKYLRQGLRHVSVEPDVASAHAQVAHALKRSGQPERALQSYLDAARCVPTLPWCDWEALKIAAILERPTEALEAAARLCAPAPEGRWAERETRPSHVADLVGRVGARAQDPSPWVRLLELVVQQGADEDERQHINAVRSALVAAGSLPPPLPMRPSPLPPQPDEQAWWQALQDGYAQGVVRDEDLLLDPHIQPLLSRRPLGEVLRIRRDF